MCGIAGCFGGTRQGDDADRVAVVRSLSAAVRHRGPDADGLWQSPDRQAVLAHRRLSVIDVDPRSNQPMVSTDGKHALSYNGELYNYRELRQALEKESWQFRTASDTEVVLAALVIWKEGALPRLDGMFAFAYYNGEQQTLLLARDRCGEKPLFFSRDGKGRLWFCSELKPLARQRPGAIDAKALCAYMLLRYVPAPDTIFGHIRQIEPGTWLRFDREGRMQRRRWYSFARDPQPTIDGKEYVDAVEEALTASIKACSVADVPVGIFLSSGIDSSLVAALAVKRLGLRFHAYCAGFPGAGKDESAHAERLARHLGIPMTVIPIDEPALLATLPRFGQCLDEPNGDRSCVPTYVLAAKMREHVTVAISGDGGDELFGGYGRYPVAYPPAPVEALPAHGPLLSYQAHGLPMVPMQAVAAMLPDAFAAWSRDFVDRNAAEFLAPGTPPEQVRRVHDFHTYLPGAVLAKVDRMSMRHALEVRTPFFSPALLRLSTFLPDDLVRQGSFLKVALRAVLGRHLPAELILPGKTGFGMPAAFMQCHQTVFAALFERAREILMARPAALPAGVVQAWSESAPRSINSLWAYIALALWLEA